MSTSVFDSLFGFCPFCSSVLPPITVEKRVVCYACGQVVGIQNIDVKESTYTIEFNALREGDIWMTKKNNDEQDGPVVERSCPKCANDKMSYTSAQLRSADEGQTIFYTCTKCKYTESENS